MKAEGQRFVKKNGKGLVIPKNNVAKKVPTRIITIALTVNRKIQELRKNILISS